MSFGKFYACERSFDFKKYTMGAKFDYPVQTEESESKKVILKSFWASAILINKYNMIIINYYNMTC